jgi:hypothetical protein
MSSTPSDPEAASGPASPPNLERFGATLGGMMHELNWGLLGRTYCWEDGDGFFGEEDQGRLLDASLAIATDLGGALGALARKSSRSLYVGVGVAEIAPMALEAIVLGRDVVACSLDGEEVRELGRARDAVSATVLEQLGPGPVLPAIVPNALELAQSAGPFSHLWFVSVISDPEAFPALHDKLYERVAGTDEDASSFATGKGSLQQDQANAEALVELALAGLEAPALLTTTDEELPFFKAALAARGLALVAPKHARLSPIVGDPLRHCIVDVAR